MLSLSTVDSNALHILPVTGLANHRQFRVQRLMTVNKPAHICSRFMAANYRANKFFAADNVITQLYDWIKLNARSILTQ